MADGDDTALDTLAPFEGDPDETLPPIVETFEETRLRKFNINFGPQHPAAHGVLRLVLELDGEVIERVDPHIGLLHRGTEKLMEARTYLQNIPYFDRLDYVAPMNQEHAFVLAIEKMLGVDVPIRGQLIRVLYCEIGRILSHLLNVTTQAMDVGRAHPAAVGLRRAREADDLLRPRLRGAAARQLLPPGRGAPGPAAGPDRGHRRLVRRLPRKARRHRDARHRQPYLQAAQCGHRRGDQGRGHRAGLHRRDAARLRRGLGPAQGPALRLLRRDGIRHTGGQEWRLLRPLPVPRRGNAPVHQYHEAVHRAPAHHPRPGDDRGR